MEIIRTWIYLQIITKTFNEIIYQLGLFWKVFFIF